MSTESSIPVHANQLEPGVEELCSSTWSCQLSSIISDIWILIAVGFAVGLILTSLAYLKSAKANLDEERSRTAAERDAFHTFAKRVSELSANGESAISTANRGSLASAIEVPESASSVEKVREAYRDTVMAVPHYDEDYGESIADNMAIEFGEEVATTVEKGQELTPMLQQVLISKAQSAADERDRLITHLDREARELNEAENNFAEVQSELEKYDSLTLRGLDLNELGEWWDRLDELEQRCNDVVNTRQQRLNEDRETKPFDGIEFKGYLYSSLPVDHPVLAEATEVLERIEDARRAVVIATTRQA